MPKVQNEDTHNFRRFFVRGVAALLPTLLTIAIVLWAYRLVNESLGVYITHGMKLFCKSISPRPSPKFVDPESDALLYGTPLYEWDEQGRQLTVEYKIITIAALQNRDSKVQKRAERLRDDALWGIAFAKYRLHLLGFVIAIILVYFVGIFLASFIGRSTWHAMERLLYRVPLIKAIYPNVKQVTDFVLSERTLDFAGVVAVQYPSKGIWSIGLTTGAPLPLIQQKSEEPLVTIFIPSSPTPITGYTITVPLSTCIELNMTIDDALRFIISAGVIKPGSPESRALLERAKSASAPQDAARS